MSETPKIPIVREPSSLLETGPAGTHFATAAAARHPVDELQRNGFTHHQDNPYQDMAFMKSVYGSALAMEIAAERQMAQREKKMGFEHLGSIYQDTTDGADIRVDVRDFLSLPDNRPELSTSYLHPYMASQLK
jgi:Proteasome maturation factor UMP1